MFKFMRERKRKQEYIDWFDGLDDDSQQETTIKYLRKLDNASLKRLYEAVDLYRQGDAKLSKVKDPEPGPQEPQTAGTEPEL